MTFQYLRRQRRKKTSRRRRRRRRGGVVVEEKIYQYHDKRTRPRPLHPKRGQAIQHEKLPDGEADGARVEK